MTNNTSQKLTPRSFAENWTISDMWDIKRLCDEQQKTYVPEVTSAMEARVKEHIAWLAIQGRLQSPPFSNHLKIQWLRAWNELIELSSNPDAIDDEQYWHTVAQAARPFYNVYRMETLMGIDKANSPEDIEKIYNRTLQSFMKGDFRDTQLSELGECFYTGERFELQLHGWTPQLGRWTAGETWGSGSFHPLTEEAKVVTITHDEVTFPSGDILFADWFRMDAFTQLGKSLDNNDNISSQLGCAQRTSAYAQHNMIHVFVGNSSPKIIQDGSDRWVAGRLSERHENKRNKDIVASTCTDLWWVTGIDKQTLIDIIQQSDTTPEDATSLVDQYIQEHGVDVVHIQPGTYHLYSTLCHTDLMEEVKVSEIKNPKHFARSHFVLSSKPLTIEPLVKSATKPKPRTP